MSVSEAPNLYYFMVNKPKGYICSNTEMNEGQGKRAIDLLEPWLAEWTRRNEKNVCTSQSCSIVIVLVSSCQVFLLFHIFFLPFHRWYSSTQHIVEYYHTHLFLYSLSQKGLPPRFFTVGRLDVATHGLVLITNDGHWAQKVIHPSAGVTKE